MISARDEFEEIRNALLASLQKSSEVNSVVLSASLGSNVRWRPHVLDTHGGRAWHVLAEPVDSDFWIQRILEARKHRPDLSVGVALPEYLLVNEELLEALAHLNAAVAIAPADLSPSLAMCNSVADVLYERQLRLSPRGCAIMLDALLSQALTATKNTDKGVTLEVLTAVLLSQVDGFEVTSRGVSNRSQQIDVMVHNRNTGGALGRSEIVIAEAKNWSVPVGTTEYFSVYRKIQTRFGRSRLGFFVTTDRFTGGVELERLRDSKGDILVVPLDKSKLPSLWREITQSDSLTRRIELATIEAASV